MRQMVAVGVLLVCMVGCTSTHVDDQSLYLSLGERDGIAAIVDEMLFLAIEDVRTSHHFAGSDLDALHGKFTDFICELVGGGCVYDGVDMRKAHRGMGLERRDFNASVEHLIDAMQAKNVPIPAQNQLLDLLADFYADVVEG
ncbi:MAG: group 1 truncated hemoglobin [Pseudomonadota bacterium]